MPKLIRIGLVSLVVSVVLVMSLWSASISGSQGYAEEDSGTGPPSLSLTEQLGFSETRPPDPLPTPTDELPHYFLKVGLEPYKDPVTRARLTPLERAELFYQVFQASSIYTARLAAKITYKPVTRLWDISGKRVLVVLPDYQHKVWARIWKLPELAKTEAGEEAKPELLLEFWADTEGEAKERYKHATEGREGRFKLETEEWYFYYSPLGVEKLTPAQMNAVLWDLYQTLLQAVTDLEFELHEVGEKALRRAADLLEMSYEEFRKYLDEPILVDPAGKPITTIELLNLPQWDADDFLPEVLIFSPLHGAWGATYLVGYGIPNVVYYDPQAHMYDWILGKPLVLEHELIHTHAPLQRLPIGFYFNIELWNSLISLLHPDDPIAYLYHSYLAALRTFVRWAFGFDAEKVRRDIWKLSGLGFYFPDKEKFKEYAEQIKIIAEELKWQTINTLYPIFYSDPIYWMSVATKFCNQETPFFAIMSMIYQGTVLEDPTGELPRAQYTAKWAAEHEELIKELAEEAFEQAGEDEEDREAYEEEVRALSWCPYASETSLPNDLIRYFEMKLAEGEHPLDIVAELLMGLGISSEWLR